MQLVKNMALNGMFGYIKGEDNVGKELVFCLKSGNANFLIFQNLALLIGAVQEQRLIQLD